jgi:2-hydroxy-3-oxopropionate reductase
MEQIGFIGLGLMGKPMAQNLVRAGFALTVHNRSRAAVDDLARLGARAANSPQEVAAQSDIVILMLPDSAAVEQVVAGANGLFDAARRGLLIVDMGTTHPRVARKLAADAHARGMDFLDAPVSGGVVGAEKATLSIMVGGTPAAFDRALPVLKALGSKVIRVGDSGAGQITKAANQIVVALNIQAVAEALTFAERAGVDPAPVREALLGGFAASRVLEVHGERMIKKNFVAGARVRTHHKDLQIALDVAKESGAHLPITADVHARFAELMERGLSDDDHSALWKLL